jgi:large subunit ribosomal protein L16
MKKKRKKNSIGNSNNNKSIKKNYKIWVNILPNYVISRKSKNSRMGKGKGSFERWVVRLKQGHILSEFIGIPKYRLNLILCKFNKKFNMKLYLVDNLKTNNNFGLWSKLNLSLQYFNKYRFM